MTLVTVFFLTFLRFGPAGGVQKADAQPYMTEAECQVQLDRFMNTEPRGVPPGVAALCVPVQMRSSNVKGV